ncbi:MAG: hypothetical protein H6684_16025 [Deltaproteobacteria bacterium]|nr:hypothetical protein [Deltaproteobacteria bacterium]
MAWTTLFGACSKGPAPPPPPVKATSCEVTPDGDVVAGSKIAWRIACEVPKSGVAVGGSMLVMFPHPYYNNRPHNMLPQATDPAAPGYARASRNGQPVEATTVDIPLRPGTVKISAKEVWRAGDKIVVTLGETPPVGEGEPTSTFDAPKALAEDFRMVVLLDATGDEQYERLAIAKGMHVVADTAVRAEVVAPSTLGKDEPFDATVRFFDAFGNIAKPNEPTTVRFAEYVERPMLSAPDEAAELSPTPEATPAAVDDDTATDDDTAEAEPAPLPDAFQPADEATIGEAYASVPAGRFALPGYRYIVAELGNGLPVEISNPIHVTIERPHRRVYFGDIHGHSAYSDGMNSPEFFYDTAAGPAALSFAALSDHEWQLTADEWRRIQALCEARVQPGKFTTLLAWEFSFGGHGIIYYDNCDAVHPQPPDGGPRELWEIVVNGARPYSWSATSGGFLRGHGDKRLLPDMLPPEGAILIPHTSATPGMGDEWEAFPRGLTPSVEVYSGHGDSESADAPRPVEPFVKHGSVSRALDTGFNMGFVAASDSHDTRPGIARWGRYPGGLTAVEVGALTRRTVFDAIAGGRTYATSGARILLSAEIDGQGPRRNPLLVKKPTIKYEAAGTAPIRYIDFIKNGQVVHTAALPSRGRIIAGSWTDDHFDEPAVLYLRLTQADDQIAWTSPFYLQHPDYARIDDFDAKVLPDGVVVSWNASSGANESRLTLLKRMGNDGDGDPAGYAAVGPADYPVGPVEFRDSPVDGTGVTAYYLLREDATETIPSKKKGEEPEVRTHTRYVGPVAAPGLVPAMHREDGSWLLGYYVPERSHVTVTIRDTEGRLVRTFLEGVRDVGYGQLVWDGNDEAGRPVNALTFYQAYIGAYTSPRVAIMEMPEEGPMPASMAPTPAPTPIDAPLPTSTPEPTTTSSSTSTTSTTTSTSTSTSTTTTVTTATSTSTTVTTTTTSTTIEEAVVTTSTSTSRPSTSTSRPTTTTTRPPTPTPTPEPSPTATPAWTPTPIPGVETAPIVEPTPTPTDDAYPSSDDLLRTLSDALEESGYEDAPAPGDAPAEDRE